MSPVISHIRGLHVSCICRTQKRALFHWVLTVDKRAIVCPECGKENVIAENPKKDLLMVAITALTEDELKLVFAQPVILPDKELVELRGVPD